MDPLRINHFAKKKINETIVYHIDSRYRDKEQYPNSALFTLPLDPPLYNVIGVRLSSIELPNLFYTFNAEYSNTSFRVNSAVVEVESGNYTADLMMISIQERLDQLFTKGSFIIKFSEITGRVTISNTANTAFSLINPVDPAECTVSLMYSLGFREKEYAGENAYTGESIIDVVGSNYVIMKLNDFGSIRYKRDMSGTAFAKVIMNSPKTDVAFDNGGNLITKQQNFLQPRKLTQFQLELIDPHCRTVDMVHMDYSLTLEILRIADPQ